MDVIDILCMFLCGLLGCSIVFQALLNARLGTLSKLNSYSALMSFLVGLPPIIIYYLWESRLFKNGEYKDLPWWSYMGGLFGAFYIFCVILSTQRLGSAVVMAIVVSLQVITSVVVDHFGILGLEQRNATIGRIIGTLLIIGGAVCVTVF